MLRIWLALLAISIIASVAGASSLGSISANVNVLCPFALQLSALPVYPQGNTITLSYAINTITQCTISSLSGYFTLSTNGAEVYNTPETIGPVNQIQTTYQLSVNTVPLQPGNYVANVIFYYTAYSNSSNAKFQLLPPANLTITSFTSSPPSLSAPINFYVNLVNNGYYAANNVILHLSITGPEPATITQNINPLSPGQSANTIITVTNASSQPGTYTARINATYLSNNVPYGSNVMTLIYVINSPVQPVPPIPGGHLPTKPPIPSLPFVSISTAPLYISAATGQVILSALGVTGTAPNNVTVTFNVSEDFEPILSISASELHLEQNTTKYIQLVFDSRNVPPGTYIIPLNISVSAGANTTTRTEYFEFVTYAPSSQAPMISEQVQVLNSSISEAEGTIMIQSSSASYVRNATLYTSLPIGLGNLSQIVAYGLPNNVTKTNLGYTIKWFVPSLPPGQTVYAYYTIVKPSNPVLLATIQNVFNEPTQPTGPSILKIVNIGIPTFYQYATTPITVSALYTGTAQQQVALSLSAPQGVNIFNATAFINATPNELLTHRFDVVTHGFTGTMLFQLQVSTKGATYNYTLPIVVLPTSTTTLNQSPILALLAKNRDAIIALVTIVVLIALVVLARSILSKPRFDADTEDRLIRLREHIKRNEENEGA